MNSQPDDRVTIARPQGDLQGRVSFHIRQVPYLSVFVPMEERHLNGGKMGGRSKVSLLRPDGTPKLIHVVGKGEYCRHHNVYWLLEDCQSCPRCMEVHE